MVPRLSRATSVICFESLTVTRPIYQNHREKARHIASLQSPLRAVATSVTSSTSHPIIARGVGARVLHATGV